MSGFFGSVQSLISASAKASKIVVVSTYTKAKQSMVPIVMYIGAADFSALCQSFYKSGLSTSTRQKIMYVTLNLLTFITMDSYSAKELLAGKASVLTYSPTAAGLVIKHFSRSQKNKAKLALTVKNNRLLKKMITENIGVFDPQVVLSRGSTALISLDPLENAYAEQVVLFNMLERMRIWQEVFTKKPGDSPEWSNKELSCREVIEQPSQENEGLLGERLAAINENE